LNGSTGKSRNPGIEEVVMLRMMRNVIAAWQVISILQVEKNRTKKLEPQQYSVKLGITQ
jgi:predicted transposase YdaD